MNKKGILFLLLTIFICAGAFAQGRKGLCINEVMIQNDSNFVDDYGMCNAWVELYNSTYAPMEISTIYLTNDPANPTMYPVPRGDVYTRIPKRQHILFWADGEPERGTFHMSFKLKPGQDNWIGVYDSNGTTLIDSITVPATVASNQSYARKKDGVLAAEGEPASSVWSVRAGTKLAGDYVTPSSNNIIIDTNEKKAAFEKNDSTGIGMTLMAMAVVFTALLLLSLSFRFIGKFSQRIAERNKMKAHGVEDLKENSKTNEMSIDSGEEIAAISMALYEHLNAHDNENTVLTINKVKKAYSPWSSKIYTLRELPRH